MGLLRVLAALVAAVLVEAPQLRVRRILVAVVVAALVTLRVLLAVVVLSSSASPTHSPQYSQAA